MIDGDALRAARTRREADGLLAAAGVTGAAAAALLAETAEGRHLGRVQAAIDAAYARVVEVAPDSECPDANRAMALFVLLADMAGIGGRGGVAGDATARVPALSRLGSGRKQAKMDGGAWTAAIREAAERLIREAGGRITLSAESADGALGIETSAVSADISSVGLVPTAWMLTLAREGLRRAAGLPGWFALPCAWQGTAAQWAAAVNRAEAEDVAYEAIGLANEMAERARAGGVDGDPMIAWDVERLYATIDRDHLRYHRRELPAAIDHAAQQKLAASATP